MIDKQLDLKQFFWQKVKPKTRLEFENLLFDDLHKSFSHLVCLAETGQNTASPSENVFENLPKAFSLEQKLKLLVIKSAVSVISIVQSSPPPVRFELTRQLKRDRISIE